MVVCWAAMAIATQLSLATMLATDDAGHNELAHVTTDTIILLLFP